MRAMFQAGSLARQQRLCDLLLAMCRGSVGACAQLLEHGAFPPVLEQVRVGVRATVRVGVRVSAMGTRSFSHASSERRISAG